MHTEPLFIVRNGVVISLLADPMLAAIIAIGRDIPEFPLVWCTIEGEVCTILRCVLEIATNRHFYRQLNTE